MSNIFLLVICHNLIFGDLFETVFSKGNDALIDDICNQLFDSDYNFYFYDDELITNNPLIYLPSPLDEVWLSKSERYAYCCDLEECHHIAEDCE